MTAIRRHPAAMILGGRNDLSHAGRTRDNVDEETIPDRMTI